MTKQWPTAPALYSPTLAAPVSVALHVIPIGTGDNARLGDKVIMRTLEIEGTVWQTSTGAASAPRPNICSRMLIVGFTESVSSYGAAFNPLTGLDPRSCIDNNKVPDDIEIFYDSGPIITTPATGSAITTTINDINRLTHSIHRKVSLSKPVHVTRMKRQYDGILATWQPGFSTDPSSGSLLAFFYSDDTVATDRVDWNVGFQVGFVDFMKGFQSNLDMTVKIAALEAKMLKIGSGEEEKQSLKS
jgi:hypothetical protein